MCLATKSSIIAWRISAMVSSTVSSRMSSSRCSKIDLALIVHHIVELEQVLADVEVARLDLLLRFLERLVDPGVNDRLVFFQTQFCNMPSSLSEPKMRMRSSSSDRKNLE